MSEQVPKKLGKYDILQKIGAGAFADVYKASDTVLDRTVALKIPAPFLLRDPGFVDSFQREARAAANLKHPNIVTIYDLGEIEGVYYIAMEYLPGRTLGDLIKEEGALPLDRALDITEQVAEALDYSHAQGLVHRDVKPSNIIVNDEGHATLTDFGLVKAMAEATLTSKGAIVGTPEYMSPEQAEGKPADRRSDIYSLGIVLYQMLTGKVPFSADSTPATLYAHVHTPLPPLRDSLPDLPPSVEEIVRRLLAKTPEDRYQTAGAFADALRVASEIVAKEGEDREERTRPQHRERLHTLWRRIVQRLTTKFEAALIKASLLAQATPLWTRIMSGTVAVAVMGILWLSATSNPPPVPATPTATFLPPLSPQAVASPPTRTPTSTRTAQPSHTPTLRPSPSATATATPVCARDAHSQLAGGWSRTKLGCPVTGASTTWTAWQRFQRGYMFWRSDTRRVTALFDDGTWTEFAEQWVEGAPIPSRGDPPAGLLAPMRGFGYIWGTYGEAAERLGWAVDREKGFCARIQSFERGVLFRSHTVQFCEDEQYNWATHPDFDELFFAIYGAGTWQSW